MTSEHEAERPFGFWTATALVVGGVIGAGVYVLPGQLAGYGWNGLAAWIVGGAAAVVIATVLTAVIEAKPDEPGLIAVIGEALGPLHGTLVGWSAWVSYWCTNAYIALTAARYGAELVPGTSGPLAEATVASAILAALTWLNLSSLQGAGRFQVITSALKVLPLIAVVAILAGLALHDPASFTAQPQPALNAGRLFEATALAFVAIIGFESSAIAAQRIRNPRRNVPLATLCGVAVCCTLYIIVCTGIAWVLPTAQVATSEVPVAMFVSHFWGGWSGAAIAAFAVISAVGGLNVWVMLQSEIPLGLVRAGLLPAWLGRTNRHDVAWAPVVIGTTLSIILIYLANWGQGAAVMDFMLRLSSVSGLWIYAFACAAALRLGVVPVRAVLSLLFCAGLLWGAGLEATLLGVVLLLSALPFYWAATRAAPVMPAAAS